MRRACLAVTVAAALFVGWMGAEAFDGARVSGVIDSSAAEVDEGYFAVGPQTMLLVKPGTGLHRWLHRNIGRRVSITIQPAPAVH